MKAYRSAVDLPRGRQVKAQFGRILHRLNPRMSTDVEQHPFSKEWGVLGRVVRNTHFYNAVESQDHDALHRYLCDYWASPVASVFFDHFSHRFEDLFLKFHSGIVDELVTALKGYANEPIRLIELGSGDGQVLEYLAEHLPMVDEFHGLDLNQKQIEECSAQHVESEKLSFHCSDIFEWLENHPAQNTVFFTNGGVLEYLTRGQLTKLFQLLRERSARCVVAITETIAVDHDLKNEHATFPYGNELAFSHNHPAVLREAGFEEQYRNDRLTTELEEWHPARWLQLVAMSKGSE